MKQIFKFILLTILFSLSLIACNKEESFAQLQEKEEKLIDNYIKDNNINVVSQMPEADAWGTSTYYRSPTGIYFHLVSQGDTANYLRLRSQVSYRYIAYDLKHKTTTSYWEPRISPFPFSIIYDPANVTDIASGIFESLGYMRNKGAVAKVIIPSAKNTSDYSLYVVPVVYDLKITSID